MKKGISIWAFAQNPIETCFELAKKYGYDGIELALNETGPLSLDSSKEEIMRIREMAQQCGIELYSLATGLYWKYSLTSDDPLIRIKAEEIVRKQIDTASWLGCDSILILPGMVSGFGAGDPVVAYDVVYERALAAVSSLARDAEEKQIKIGLENVWNKFLLSPMEMRSFIDQVNSPWVGAYFDVGNVVRDGYPQQWITILKERIVKIHFKDYKRAVGTIDGFVDLLSGDVDFYAVMKALHQIGYDGWVTAEVFPYAQHPEVLLQNTSCALDRIFSITK